MAFVPPTREKYDPTRNLTVPFQGWAKCIRVEQGLPHPTRAGKFNCVITFEVQDNRFPALKGLRTAIVAQETVYVDPDTGRESHFLQHGRSMGAPNPERGFDPEQFVGKLYHVTCEVVDGRAFVRLAIPYQEPVPQGPPPAAKRERQPAPPIDGQAVPN